ncbi:hypothetical protein VTL71DRAFT_1532 [Oculimacula yallundae]|uniref:Enoyl reductase (ER) domain-containing protein n=1 Tax=Oculimacula yallundae TaxID=86028 RepID=A0ABR4CAY4_9HELO
MATQTALALVEIAKPLQKITVPIPEPKEHQLLVKISVTGIIPLDQKLRDDNLHDIRIKLPVVMGFDIVGSVVKQGPNTSLFPIGSKIFSQALYSLTGNFGGFQVYTLVDERYSALVPSNISDADAALFPINALTSAIALFSDVGPNSGFGFPFPGTKEAKGFDYEGVTLLIIGGGTVCGKFAVQFARIAGIGRIIVTASLDSEKELKDFGATHVLDRRADNLASQIKALVGDELVYLYDTYSRGDHTFGVSLLSTTRRGMLVHLVPGLVDEAVAKEKKAGFVEKQVTGSSQLHPDLAKVFWKVFPQWVETGEVKVLPYGVIEGLDGEKINAVLDGYRDGKFDRWHLDPANQECVIAIHLIAHVYGTYPLYSCGKLNMSAPVYLVSADSVSLRAKDVTASVIKGLEKEYNLVHVANCESIATVKHVLKSLVTPPRLLIISGTFFEEETEEIRGIAKRVLPDIRVISIPIDRDGNENQLIEYLQEQVENSGVPTRDGLSFQVEDRTEKSFGGWLAYEEKDFICS